MHKSASNVAWVSVWITQTLRYSRQATVHHSALDQYRHDASMVILSSNYDPLKWRNYPLHFESGSHHHRFERYSRSWIEMVNLIAPKKCSMAHFLTISACTFFEKFCNQTDRDRCYENITQMFTETPNLSQGLGSFRYVLNIFLFYLISPCILQSLNMQQYTSWLMSITINRWT